VHPGAKFCIVCGAKLSTADAAVVKPPSPAEPAERTPNPDHYAAVLRIVAKVDAFRGIAKRELETTPGTEAPERRQARAVVDIVLAAMKFWKEEFPPGPAGQKSPGPNLRGANFDSLPFLGSMLERAQMQGASLVNTQWNLSSLEGADLTGACLRGARAIMVSASGCCIREADLSQAELDFRFGPETLDFSGARLTGSKLELIDAAVDHTRTPPVDFTGADLTGAKVKLDVYKAPTFTGACIKNCTLLVPKGLDVEAALSPEQRGGATVTRYRQERKSDAQDSEKTGGCFIATAACGTEQAEDVVRLRQFASMCSVALRGAGRSSTFTEDFRRLWHDSLGGGGLHAC
jgi:uncharacterized protein YjbI with pentapeptide repeats